MNTSTTLGFAIRAVRERLRKTMSEFADMIGCRQSTVSRYEAGKLVPSRTVLLLLLQLAEGPEKQPLLAALGVPGSAAQGWIPSDLADALRTFDSYLSTAGGSADLTCSGAARGRTLARFAGLSAQIVSEGREIEPALAVVLELWLKHRANRQAWKYFRHVAAYLEVELSVLKTAEQRNRPMNGVQQRRGGHRRVR